jgi:PhzF family phenazine biosynthesis protein
MEMTRQFQLVDVFGDGSFTGNALAVVAGGSDLDGEAMLGIARWLNLSETTFLLPPTEDAADYRVRIFTLERELAFAGHPTLGSCHAWLKAGGKPKRDDRIVQQCGAGLIPIRRDRRGLAFAGPPVIRDEPVDDAKLAEMLELLRIPRSDVVEARWADNGPGWAAVLLSSAEAVLAVEPARAHPRRIDVGIIGPYPAGSELAFELRTFFSDQHGAILEDPVTGSFNASAAQWMLASGRASSPYIASQGTRLGRSGRVRIEQDDDGTVWVGGATETLFSGEACF